ncbi:MAG: STAS domain-containing protein [Phycisphaerales bacterium]|nr:STAS domain-containing protein [Phycisphaerales bacterium]
MNSNVFNPYVSTSLKDGVYYVCIAAPRVGDHEAAIIAASVHRTLREHGRSLRTMVLDVSSVQMMQSVGLGMCIDIRNTADAFGVPTSLVGLRGRLAQLFRMLKIDRLFTLEAKPATATQVEAAAAA